MAYDGIEDMGERIDRAASWDDTSLDGDRYKTEMIAPVNVSAYDGGTDDLMVSAHHMLYHLKNWILESIDRTMKTGNEHAFYVDAYSNVIGIYEGDETSVQLPKDYSSNYVVQFHTHPPGDYEIGGPVHSTPDSKSMMYRAEKYSPVFSAICPVPKEPSDTAIIGLLKNAGELKQPIKNRGGVMSTDKIMKKYNEVVGYVLRYNIDGFDDNIRQYKSYSKPRPRTAKRSLKNLRQMMKRDFGVEHGFTHEYIDREEIEEYLSNSD